jgi:hypothetical protein
MSNSSFGKAFSEARKAGQQTFEFNGKKFTTRTADQDNAIEQKTLKAVKMGENVPRRTPGPLYETRKPGTNTNYENTDVSDMSMKRGGAVKKMASGGSASSRADGIAVKGKTKGRVI